MFTSIEKKKQATTILRLTGQARETIVEIDIEKRFCDQGFKNVVQELVKPGHILEI